MPDSRSDLFVVLLTPPGRGAMATIRVEGVRAVEAVEAAFRPAGAIRLRDASADRPLLDRFGPDPAEEVVVRRVTDAAIEIHCHGGHAAVTRIVKLLESAAQSIGWEPWARSQDADPLRASAQVALAQARTRTTAAILLDQYQGALCGAIDDAVRLLAEKDLSRAAQRLADLLKWAPLGMHLVEPWRVVVAGAANVGKSSLINALLGYARAIVHPAPGTTRDLVTAETILAGWPVRLIDTAGLRDAEDPLEQAGIERAGRESANADLVVLLFDLTRPWSPSDDRLCRQWPAALVVHNKSDLPEARRAAGISVSAATGEGIESLLDRIAERLVPETPAPGTAVPFQSDQIAALRAAASAIEQGDAVGAGAVLQVLQG